MFIYCKRGYISWGIFSRDFEGQTIRVGYCIMYVVDHFHIFNLILKLYIFRHFYGELFLFKAGKNNTFISYSVYNFNVVTIWEISSCSLIFKKGSNI